jgi:hypothetical protein
MRPPSTEPGITADSITAVAVPWSVHNAALKYYRDCVLTAEVPCKILTTDEWVKSVVHEKTELWVRRLGRVGLADACGCHVQR